MLLARYQQLSVYHEATLTASRKSVYSSVGERIGLITQRSGVRIPVGAHIYDIFLYYMYLYLSIYHIIYSGRVLAWS